MRTSAFVIALLLALSTDARRPRDDKPARRPDRPDRRPVGGDDESEYDESDLECMENPDACMDDDFEFDEDSDDDFGESDPEQEQRNACLEDGADTSACFHQYTARFSKHYENRREYQERYQTWLDRRELVRETNAAADASGDPEALRLTLDNEFADGTHRRGRFTSHHDRDLSAVEEHGRELQDTAAIDWTAYGTGVKNQGACGSCYAFAATTALEASVAKTSGTTPVRLSEQEIVDCSFSQGNAGCNGGLENLSWAYHVSQGGAVRETEYPYISDVTLTHGTCATSGLTKVAQVNSYTNIGEFSGAADIISRLADGPVSLGINANTAFESYSSGTMTAATCDASPINHAVVIMGYEPGTGESTEPIIETQTFTRTRCRRRRRRDYRSPTGCRRREWYVHPYRRRYCCKDVEYTKDVVIQEGTTAGDAYFLVQNSWGTGWGDNGFVKFKVETSGAGACGMNLEPMTVTGSSLV